MHGRGEGGEYEYFYCLGRQEKNGCPQRYIPVATAEALVERYYASSPRARIDELLPELQDAAFVNCSTRSKNKSKPRCADSRPD